MDTAAPSSLHWAFLTQSISQNNATRERINHNPCSRFHLHLKSVDSGPATSPLKGRVSGDAHVTQIQEVTLQCGVSAPESSLV